MEIKCWACMEPGAALTPWTYSIPAEPLDHEVDVEITHCGMCHSDLHQIDNAWGVACFPLVPGHEIVGTAVKVGKSVSGIAVGDTVGIGVQRGCCNACEQCQRGREHTCPKITKTYAGPGKDKGGFAEQIRYPSDWVFKIPSTFPREYAAPLLCAGITTFSPLKQYCPKPAWFWAPKTGTVGIIGIGGLGHIAIQIAAAMAENVVAISTSPAKKDECTALGATDFLVSKDASQMASYASKFDMLLNTVSGVQDMDGYLALLKPEGVLACVGLPEKDQKVGVFMQSFVLAERKIVGSYLGPKADYKELFEFCEKNNVKPMVEMFQSEQFGEALTKLRNNELRYRAVIEMPAAKKLKESSGGYAK